MADEKQPVVECCANCGLLSLRKGDIDQLADTPAGITVRKGGMPSNMMGFDRKPYCCINADPIDKEYDRGRSGTEDSPKYFLQVIERQPRVCGHFTEWVPSLTPKEHIEMNRELARQRDSEARLVKDEAFREEIRKADRERDDRLGEESGKRERKNRRIDLQYKELEKEMRSLDMGERAKQWKWSFRAVITGIIASALIGATSVGVSLYTALKPTQPPPVIINQITVPPTLTSK